MMSEFSIEVIKNLSLQQNRYSYHGRIDIFQIIHCFFHDEIKCPSFLTKSIVLTFPFYASPNNFSQLRHSKSFQFVCLWKQNQDTHYIIFCANATKSIYKSRYLCKLQSLGGLYSGCNRLYFASNSYFHLLFILDSAI